MRRVASDTPMTEQNDLEATFGRFCRVLELAERRFAEGRAHEAVALAQIAARIAYPADAGLFASARLERLLIQVGQTIEAGFAEPGTHRPSRLRVLHVLSYARPIGGDTRFVSRWILEDAGNKHSVAVTTQADLPGACDIAQHLEQAVTASGGSVDFIDKGTSCPLEQAARLRRLCQSADIVALHLFPYDVIPILALAAGCDGVRTIFVDHSDHTFWVGASVAHLIAHLRTQSLEFLRRCRGAVLEESVLLPIPLGYKASSASRSEAKRLLGYWPDDVLLLTIASPFKYSAPGRLGLLDLAVPVLREHRDALLLAAGPTAEGAWGAANIETNGRVVAMERALRERSPLRSRGHLPGLRSVFVDYVLAGGGVSWNASAGIHATGRRPLATRSRRTGAGGNDGDGGRRGVVPTPARNADRRQGLSAAAR
jgi:hypothetical protein